MGQSSTDSRGTIAVVAAPLIAVSIIDIFMLIFGLNRFLVGSEGRWIIMFGHMLFAPGALWVVLVATKLGNRGWIVGLASFVLSYIVITRFRGPWVWQGILDYWQMSKQPWLLSAFTGVVGGLFICAVNSRASNKAVKYPDDLKFISALGVCGILDLVASMVWPFDSIFPPTFHLAIGAVTVVLTGFWFWFVRSEVANEKRVYAN